MNNSGRLKMAFAQALGISMETNFESLKYQGIVEWDSVAHMQLINEIEATFDIMLPTEDVIDMSSFIKACEIVSKHGVSIDA
jgi:acyl carrier protein